ncbi:hypothetical protein JTE90_024572 [Oedothorax gibbosus]|uniref:SWI/SNF-related matrix-associated actin-dependent regulator of chromatin subfamily A containing DEAD/H box 1 homolog n=1 Tax=Oedothorax gibbosus TaxID=931172 RepID=A0AAV6VD13_9ARAC|nr:hypothetical protein JTE90_024572 [Oedothorax gibbosus]
MPGSCDSDNNSSPSVISSLRNFRFARQPKKYQPPSQTSPTTSQNSLSSTESPASQSPDSTSTNKISNGTPSKSSLLIPTTINQSSPVASTSNLQYGPLSYRKYDSIATSQFLLTCIIAKFHSALKKSKSHNTELEITVTNEENKKVKEIILQDTAIAQKWKSCVTHEEHSFDSSCEKVLKINRTYVSELIKLIKQEAQDILVKCNWNFSKAIVNAQNLPLRCSKKRAFSTSSVDSATSQTQELSSTPQQISAPRTSTTSSTAEEIVLDSSDDEEVIKPMTVNNNKNKIPPDNHSAAPAAKKPRMRITSSDSEEDRLATPNHKASSLSFVSTTASKPTNVSKSSSVVVIPANVSSTVTVVNPSSTVVKPAVVPKPLSATKPSVSVTKPSNSVPSFTSGLKVTVSKVNDKDKTFSVSQSVSVKAVPTSSTVTVVPNGSAPVSQTIPNLPKGLMITQVGSLSNASSTESINNTSKTDASSTQPETTNNIPSYTRIVTSGSNKSSSQVVRIQSSNGVTAKASDNPSTSAAATKSLSIIPKEVSVTLKGGAKDSEAGSSSSGQKPKNTKAKRKRGDVQDEDDEDYGNEGLIYDSEDSDFEEENLTAAHSAVLKYFQESSHEELLSIPGCSKKKVDSILNVRPFQNWGDLVAKLGSDKYLSTDLLNGAKKVLDMRNAISKLMTKCQRISLDMEDLVENLKENKESSSGYVNKQPDLLNDKMHLTPYQMLGLNWMLLMDNQEVNGILADEMGLGKTVQAIAFLAYLKQMSNMSGPHLIVVPSSVMDNWKQEFQSWWPDVSMICYHGSQDSRRELRMQILNEEIEEFDVMITTYNMVTSSSEDRGFFKRLEFQYVIFDEAHMLKNMASQRYQHLMKIRAPRRLLLTGTPLQNNLVELMSLLIFAMPNMFSGKTESIKHMFSTVSKSDTNKNSYEKQRIDHAKRIMKPFVLRRLKKDVLQDLPPKHDETKLCPMVEDQAKKYAELVEKFSVEVQNNKEENVSSSGAGMMMQLRRGANHPLLLRRFYDEDTLKKMSKAILKEPTHTQSDATLVFEDMQVMSDFELHQLCKKYKTLNKYVLSDEDILNSGKFKVLESLLPKLIEEGHRVLLFSQFTMVLDIIEYYMNVKKYKFLRLDGQVPVQERQQLIDEFNSDPEIFVFLLSTRAGGLGINLTAADTVILHDIDFNPYNDKQAEDRCHRVGQIRDVNVIRLISENTIEEGILQRATEKLKLERDIHEEDDTEENDVASVAKLLRDALGIKNIKS